ncbi:hybrid-cluster NAD(P)-dependent oxidoreductase [Amorphus orientalis]|uniref:Ferredoxin-NADP reductase n=1 Tax=Amorphus orientalis TaxID=649198 RepID=A0AAE3VLS6_9HYPH|nr:hybrid-cluster NAD(P)-dependent oxidoreductase [Amorphus orientalis]MDQ0314387.1 ferredoxin-NADP reductase [Amorphus orientalis]
MLKITDAPTGSPYLHLDEMQPWNDHLQTLECVWVTDEAPGVKTFAFRSDNQTWFRYKPGQFVTLELPVGEEPVMRTYTLSSSPSRPFSISITAKAQADSIGTRWMFENLVPGMRVKAYGPAGGFSLYDHPAGRYFFLSAGSGITPMMSMLRWLYDCAPMTDVSFVNCARRPDEIIFRSELELLASRMPGLSLGFLVEERPRTQSWFGPTGRLDLTRLALLVPDFADREVFCCGPEPFMRAVRVLLEASGFDMQQYHQESFGTGPIEPVPAEIAEASDGLLPSEAPEVATTPVTFTLSGVEAEAYSGQSILQTARASGVRIPAACELGLCGTCKVKASGPIEMNHNGGILDDDIADGYVLACCSTPRGPVSVEA